jgi:hypothetical protein
MRSLRWFIDEPMTRENTDFNNIFLESAKIKINPLKNPKTQLYKLTASQKIL